MVRGAELGTGNQRLAYRRILLLVTTIALAGCGADRPASDEAVRPAANETEPACAFGPEAAAWAGRWLDAWALTSTDVLDLPNVSAPSIVFFDDACVYTTVAVTAPGAAVVPGPGLGGERLEWRAAPHGGTITLPDSSEMPVALTTFASYADGGPYIAMAAPLFWEQAGVESEELGRDRLVTGVFVHEVSHTRHAKAYGSRIDAVLDSLRALGVDVDAVEPSDNVAQNLFGDEPAYVEAQAAERDLLFRAAEAETDAEVRALAAEALAMMRQRRAEFLAAEPVAFELDDLFLAMEGAGQAAGLGWLTHPDGGGLDRATALAGWNRGGWPERHGLALFLVLDRLLPEWPRLVYGDSASGAEGLLTRAVGE